MAGALAPDVLFVMWGAGVAIGAALVAFWRVVGRGFLWLAGAVAAGLAVLAGAAGAGAMAWVAAALVVAGAVLAERPVPSGTLFALGAALLLIAGYQSDLLEVALLVTGTLLLGGVTSEMLLGHWFLVDPTLPRKPLFDLDESAAIGLVGEVAVMVVSGALAFGTPLTWVWLALAVTTAALIAGVWFSLREPRYSGVMAATGLSYLAVLVSFGVVAAGRSLVAA